MKEDLFGNKELPFKTPENYFEDFEQSLLAKVETEGEKHSKDGSLVPVIKVLKPWLAMAAAFVIIALIYYQAPKLFNVEETVVLNDTDDEFINSLAFIIDENDINELIIAEDSFFILPSDTSFWENITEDELAAVTYFE